MADICRSAYVTIITASGDNADAGLLGLRLGTRTTSQEELLVCRNKDNGDSQRTSIPTISVFQTLKLRIRPTSWFRRG